MADALHVDPASGDIGGDQHADSAVLKVLQGPLPGSLGLVPVDGLCHHLCAPKPLNNPVGAVLSAGKHQRTLDLRSGKDFSKKPGLVTLLDEQDALLDPLDSCRSWCHLDANRIMKNALGQLRDRVRHRR